MYVVRRGWHIDLAFAVADLESPLAAVANAFPGARFVSLGFGDRHYLEARNKSFPGMLVAVWPGAGLILATGLSTALSQAFGEQHVIALPITGEQMRNLQAFVWDSFAHEDNRIRIDSQGPYEGSTFFASTVRYSGFNTCNTWAAKALKTAGLPVHTTGVVFASQLWSQVERIADAGDKLSGYFRVPQLVE